MLPFLLGGGTQKNEVHGVLAYVILRGHTMRIMVYWGYRMVPLPPFMEITGDYGVGVENCH